MEYQKNRFAGLNKDDDPRDLKDGAYRYALNCRVGSSNDDNRGMVENVKGNTLVSVALPAGTNKVIGSYEDRIGSVVYYFLYNSSASHGIYKYTISNNTITKIFEWSGLNFSSNHRITGVELVDDMLFWVDGYNDSRKLNVVDAPTYPSPYIEAYINHVKNPPLYPPAFTTSLVTPLTNLMDDKGYQFALRYVYNDYEKSVLSPFSKIAVTGYQSAKKDTITLDLTAGGNNIEFTDTGGGGSVNRYSSIISHVEILFRDSPTAAFRLAKKLKFTDAVASPTFVFKNDESYPIVSTTETIKLFDAVPRKPKALSFVKGRMYLANYYEGFAEYDLSVTRTVPDTYTDFTNPNLNDTFLKDGCRYQFGVVFYDAAGRRSGVYTNGDLKVNVTDFKSKKYATISFDLNGDPPEWATHYQIVRSENLTMSHFFQARIDNAFYLLSEVPEATNFRHAPSPRPAANDINLDDSNSIGLWLDTTNFLKYNNNTPYTFTEGDRISFLTIGRNFNIPGNNPDDNPATYDTAATDANLKNIKIKSSDAEFLKLDWSSAMTQVINSSALVEIFTPRSNTGSLIFYEIGEVYPITNPGEVTRAFSQTSFSISDGDCYYINKTWVTSNHVRVAPNDVDQFGVNNISTNILSVHFNSKFITEAWQKDIGQPNIVNDIEKEQHKTTGIRISNQYVQATNINGLCSFEALNEKVLPSEYGAICKLQIASNDTSESNVLLSVHSNEIATLYIEEATFSDVSGQTIIAISDKIIGSVRALRGSYGSINPESIVQKDGRVYGWDQNKGVVWRYSQDGLTPISDVFCKNYFYDKSQELLPNKATVQTPAVYDPYFGEYILTLNDETIAWSENLNRWTTFYSFVPECLQSANTRMVSFKNGALYLHAENATHNNFYGVQYSSKIQISTNQFPSSPKLFRNISTESNSVWVGIAFTTPEGQESSLVAADYEERENVFYAVIMRDLNTIGLTGHRIPIVHGDIIRSAYMLSMLENTATTKATIFAATVGFEPSRGHKV